ncbi:MAG TPA: ATP-binding protein [Mucilaginibacter sp.]|jgi:PAS domain S-box-containing protein|nr:ATP-binding protein [Mucilaginibacter sp.]
MINIFKRLSLPYKLILIGLVPSLFLVYLSVQFYLFEKQKYNLSKENIEIVDRSTMVSRLIDQLQAERRFAYEYALKKDKYPELLVQQNATDKVIAHLESDPDLRGFEHYTMLDSLAATRKRSDAHKMSAGEVMNYYTTAIFRISMLEVTPLLQIANARLLTQELHSARAMSQIITYLGILRSNIYNVLYTRQFKYGNGTLQGLLGVYMVFSTYQTEFKAKSSPQAVADYDFIMQHQAKPLMDYLHKSFKTMQFDSTTYTDVQWWKLSGNAVEKLRGQQIKIWNIIHQQLNAIKDNVHRNQTILLVLLVLALVLSIFMIATTIISITGVLTELRVAAEKIAVGETGLHLSIDSNDVIGRLASSVAFIDANNRLLAETAGEIRKGNFDVDVTPRGESDILGNSLLQMKNELRRNTEEKAEQAAELKRLLVAVKASENHFRQIADQTPFMIWQFNNRGRAIYVNQQWIDFTGLSREESLGAGWTKALHPDGMKEGGFVKLFAGLQAFRTKARFKNVNNGYRWVLVQANPIFNNGTFEGFIGSLTDISDQIAAQQALMDLMDKKDEFLTIASHELKTPLTSIKAYTQLLKKNFNSDDKSHPLASKTLYHVARLEKLVNDLLDVSRINSGQMVYKDETFDMKEMLEQNVEHFMDVSSKHKVVIENTVSVQITGDRVRIEQVFNNLLNNAAKYSPDADKIIINSYSENGYVVVSVQDFGIGIEDKDKDMLFQKFYRTQKDFYKFQGLGLGLFISGEIIARHKGTLWVDSQPGKGSTFYFKLPLDNS